SQGAAARRHAGDLAAGDRVRATAVLERRLAALAPLAAFSPESLQARQRDVERRRADANLTPDERRQLAAEAETIEDMPRSGAAASMALYAGLTPAQRQQLRGGGQVRLSTADGTLTPSLAAKANQAVAALARWAPGRTRPAEAVLRLTDEPDLRLGPQLPR